jgi:hypothetical protein
MNRTPRVTRYTRELRTSAFFLREFLFVAKVAIIQREDVAKVAIIPVKI